MLGQHGQGGVICLEDGFLPHLRRRFALEEHGRVGLEHGEGGVHAGLEGILPEDAPAKAMDGAYGASIERSGEIVTAPPLEVATDAVGQLAGGLSREGDGDQALDGDALVEERVHVVGDKQAGLAASGPRRHQHARRRVKDGPRLCLGQPHVVEGTQELVLPAPSRLTDRPSPGGRDRRCPNRTRTDRCGRETGR